MVYPTHMHEDDSPIRGHVLAIQGAVIGHANLEDIEVAFEEFHTIDYLGIGRLVALNPTIDDVGAHAEARCSTQLLIRGRGAPMTSQHGMATGLRCLGSHPKPDRSLVRKDRVLCQARGLVEKHVRISKESFT